MITQGKKTSCPGLSGGTNRFARRVRNSTYLSSVISSFFSNLIRTCSITCHWHHRYQQIVLEKKLVMIFQPFNWLQERWYMYFHVLIYFIKNCDHCYHDENFKSRLMSYSSLTTRITKWLQLLFLIACSIFLDEKIPILRWLSVKIEQWI